VTSVGWFTILEGGMNVAGKEIISLAAFRSKYILSSQNLEKEFPALEEELQCWHIVN
jgi:hypothetical protein